TMSHTVNDAVAMPLVSAFVNGYTVSTIAYGQTGAGKTFTMSSLSSDVVRRISAALKADVTAEGGEKPEFRVSAVELYNENICDLIASTISSSSSIAMASVASLSLREDPRCGVYIQGLSEVAVESEEELLAWVENSSANRRTASTMLNATSSRSHALLTITLTHNGVVSRFGLVDLAGSERFKKTYGRQRRTG
ncbi:kinesin, partial [Trypanosoma cruzi]